MHFILAFLLKNRTQRVDSKPLLDLEQHLKFTIKLLQFKKLLHFNPAVTTAIVRIVLCPDFWQLGWLAEVVLLLQLLRLSKYT